MTLADTDESIPKQAKQAITGLLGIALWSGW
jgi:hypothetical protein